MLCDSVPPEILPSSSCTKILSQFKCSCLSKGNPLPSLVWELGGEPVNHSADIPIREIITKPKAIESHITLYRLNEDIPSLVCISSNSLGSDSLAYNVSTRENPLGRTLCSTLHSYTYSSLISSSYSFGLGGSSGLHTKSLLIGSAAGALGMLVLCVPLLIYVYR